MNGIGGERLYTVIRDFILLILTRYVWFTSLGLMDFFFNFRRLVINYFLKTLRTHNAYTYKFVFCEFLNLFNIFGKFR